MNTLVLHITVQGGRVIPVTMLPHEAVALLKAHNAQSLPETIGEIAPGHGGWSVLSKDISAIQVFDPVILNQIAEQQARQQHGGPAGGHGTWCSGGKN